MLVIVVYDISCDQRRLKVSNLLEGYGRRVQYSVFECFLNRQEMEQLHRELATKTKPAEGDNVRLYWITKEAMGKTLTIGTPPPEEPPDLYII